MTSHVEGRPAAPETSASIQAPLRVLMMDLLSMVPYYDGHLYLALSDIPQLDVVLAAITYQHDRTYFSRERIRIRPGVDIAGRLNLPKTPGRLLKGLEATVNLGLLSARLAVWQPDVLHVQFMPLWEVGVPFEWWVVRQARSLGIKIVHTIHNVLPAPNEGKSREFHFRRYRRLYRNADALICHDDEAKLRLIREFGADPGRITIIPHGPLFAGSDVTSQPDARRKLGLQPDSVLVLWQGILRPYKGVDFLLDAWREVSPRNKNAHLAIVGGGSPEMNAAVRARVDALGLRDSVRLELRFVPVEELGHWYSAADLLVYPYREATTSGALMTGYNYAKPVIATDLPAFRQAVRNGENGMLVTYGDVTSLAAAIKLLISEPALRDRFSERIRISLSSCPQWPSIAQATVDCYRRTVSGAPQ